MKTRIFRASFIAAGVAVFSVLSLPAQAQTTDIAVLHSKVDNIDSTLVRIDKRFDRIEDVFGRMEKSLDSLYNFNRFVFIPALFLILAGVIALFFKGALWGVAP